MHQTRRKKKRPIMANLKTVEVARGRNGYGFTLSGQSPCILSCIMGGSPAELAGLKAGDYVMAVNGENVAKLSHEQVVKLIGVSTAVLRLTIAEKQRRDHSDSSDDDFVVNRPRPRSHPRMKTRTPPTPTNDYQSQNASRVDKVVEDLFRGTLFGTAVSTDAVEEIDEDEENEKSDKDSRLAPGHLSPYNKSGKFEVFLKKPHKLYDRKVWTGKGFDDEMGAKAKKNKPKYSERHQVAKQQMQFMYQQQQQHQQHLQQQHLQQQHLQQQHMQQQHLQQQHFQQQYDPGRFMSTPDPALIHRPLSPLEVSSILYPSLQPHVSAAIPLDIEHELDEDDLYLSVVVGYLGSIEIPAEANLQTASLQAIRGCVRRLRIEQRIHTLVLMEITIRDVRLVTSNGAIVVVYPAEKLAFTGVCPDDKRFFGLVTMHGLEDAHEMGALDKENFGSSCHVFMVDPEICAHNVHAKKAAKFGIQCAVDPETNGCREFPRSAKPILRTLAKLYQDRHNGLYVNELQRAQVYMSGDYPLDARRSNSNSSNSDSGIGYCRDSEGMNGSGSGDRIVVDNPKSMHGSYDGQGTPTPNRLLVKADVMHNSFDVPYPSSMKQHLSAEVLHKNVTSVDMASRLSPRVRTHPQELDRPVSRLSMNVYSDSVDSNDAQESLNRAQHVSENEYSDEPKTMARAPTGLPPTGIHRHSMYAKVDNTGSKKDAAERETQGVSARRISDGRILLKNQDLRNGSGKALMHRGMKNKKSPGW
ncbi:regulator of G-protein signaling 12-like isoform X1 [Ptychodera flava]|uniref:regulator of G-protein signaling 12-like isoform X1 n=1 Tax=Ptychodera flava TaxID=63121 RepID=UPI00396A39F1